MLALSRQSFEDETTVAKLVAKMAVLERTPNAQDVANVFLAFHERGWAMDKSLAATLLR